MKKTILSCLAFILAVTVNAQFSLLPQVGFEQSRTTLTYGNGLSALNGNANVKAGLKLNYTLKGVHTPFINLTTTPAPVLYTFNNSGALINAFQSGTPKFMLQAGYQYSSKAISLGKKTSAANATPQAKAEGNAQQHRCGSMYRSRCGQQRMNRLNPVNDALTMRLQPALALAYVPSAAQTLTQNSNGTEYKAAAWKTALVPSMGFEFAKGQQRLFTLSVFYTQPLTQTEQTATLASDVKAVPVLLQTKTSSWGLTLGIPFGFAKKARVVQSQPTMQRHQCHRNYYGRCTRVQ